VDTKQGRGLRRGSDLGDDWGSGVFTIDKKNARRQCARGVVTVTKGRGHGDSAPRKRESIFTKDSNNIRH